MAYRNFVKEANMIAYKRILSDKDTLNEAYENCSTRFWSYCGIAHYMAHEEYLKVYDYYEEHNLIRGFTKRAFKICDEEFQRYNDHLQKDMEERPRYLLTDFHNQVYAGLSKQLLDLKLTFKFYYERAGLTDLDNKAQITVTNSIIAMAAELWHNYFDIYKEQYIIDFSKDFQFAKLDNADRLFNEFAEDVVQCKKLGLHPTQNYASVQAFNALCAKMVDEDFLDKNGYKALKFNHFDKELDELERERMGFDRLKERFTVK